MDDTILVTERVRLRLMRTDDAAELARVFDDDYARRFYPQTAQPENIRRWIAKNLDRYRNDGVGLWALCLAGTDDLIGDCGLTFQKVEESSEMEVGYHLRVDHRGKGYVTEAARACMNYAFEKLDRSRVVSMVHPDNSASMAVANRIHRRSRRFERLGSLYHLFYTEKSDRVANDLAHADTRTAP